MTRLEFDTPLGSTRAFLINAPGDGAKPVVLFGHPTGADAEYFLDEAQLFAERGLAALTVDLPYRPPFPGPLYSDERDRQALLDAVHVMVSAVDFVVSQPQIDPRRIGYVGSSLGGTVGVQLAATDKRVSALALMSAVARIADYASFPNQPRTQELVETGRLDDYLALMGDVDPITHAAQTAPAAVLLQFGEQDWLVPRDSANELAAATADPSEARWYAGGHDLDDAAQADRLDWLSQKLTG